MSVRIRPSAVSNAELCSGSTKDFGSLSPGSNPGSAALFPGSSMVEQAAVNCKVVGSNPTRGANLGFPKLSRYKMTRPSYGRCNC